MPVARRKEAKSDDSKVDKESKTNNADQKKKHSKESKLLPIFILAATIAVGAYAYNKNLDAPITTDEVDNRDKYKDESKRPAVGIGSETNNADLSVIIADDGQIFTASELKQYTGDDPEKPIYLAVLGQVFDVTKGKEHYAKGGGYGFFSGRDGTRAFITGDFTEKGLIDDIKGLTYENLIGIKEWIDFYHKDYSYVGKLVGRYYDAEGKPAAILSKIKTRLVKAYKLRAEAQAYNLKMPGCNTRWTKEEGTVYWCENKSGAIERDWDGVPRRLFSQNGKSHRCACVRTTGPSSFGSGKNTNNGDLDYHLLKEYEGCGSTSKTCKANDVE